MSGFGVSAVRRFLAGIGSIGDALRGLSSDVETLFAAPSLAAPRTKFVDVTLGGTVALLADDMSAYDRFVITGTPPTNTDVTVSIPAAGLSNRDGEQWIFENRMTQAIPGVLYVQKDSDPTVKLWVPPAAYMDAPDVFIQNIVGDQLVYGSGMGGSWLLHIPMTISSPGGAQADGGGIVLKKPANFRYVWTFQESVTVTGGGGVVDAYLSVTSKGGELIAANTPGAAGTVVEVTGTGFAQPNTTYDPSPGAASSMYAEFSTTAATTSPGEVIFSVSFVALERL